MKKNKKKNKYVTGVTKAGFRFSIDPEIMTDMRFIELMEKVDSTGFGVSDLLNLMFGKKQKENLYKFCQEKDGKIPARKIYDTIKEIMEDEKVKNSISLPEF